MQICTGELGQSRFEKRNWVKVYKSKWFSSKSNGALKYILLLPWKEVAARLTKGELVFLLACHCILTAQYDMHDFSLHEKATQAGKKGLYAQK